MSKTVLLVVPTYSSYFKPIKQALNELGFKVRVFDNRRTLLYEKVIFFLSLKIKWFYKLGEYLINCRLYYSAKKLKPDLVLVIKGENLLGNTIRDIKNLTPIINWFPDYFRGFKRIEDWLKNYTAFFTGDRFEVEFYRQKYKNLFHLPYAGPLIRDIPEEKRYDVVFIGTYSKDREETFLPLKDLGLLIWGDTRWKQSKLGGCYQNRWLSFDDCLNVLKNSKIVINNHQNSLKENTLLNMRVYEATSCQALLVCDEREELPEAFNIGEEVITYQTKEDLRKKVNYFLTHDAKRRAIARRGYQRLNKDHNYRKRIEYMLSRVKLNI